jgi:hypothetical protein
VLRLGVFRLVVPAWRAIALDEHRRRQETVVVLGGVLVMEFFAAGMYRFR